MATARQAIALLEGWQLKRLGRLAGHARQVLADADETARREGHAYLAGQLRSMLRLMLAKLDGSAQ